MPGPFESGLNPSNVDPETLAAFVDEVPAGTDETPSSEVPAAEPPGTTSGQAPAASPAGTSPTQATVGPPEPPTGESVSAEHRWANKYESPDDLEKAYLHLQALQTRTFQENQTYEQRIAQLEDGLRQAMPYIEAGASVMRGQGQGVMQAPAEVIDFDDPEAVRNYIDQQVAQRTQALAAQQQQMVQAQQQQSMEAQYRAAGEAAIAQFATKHPDVVGNQEAEQQVAEMVRIYNLDMRDADQLELAWEVWQNPLVGEAIAANPARVTSPQGRAEARFLAGQMAAARQGPPAAGAPARPRPAAPHVEIGSGAPVGGSPPGSQSDRDEFDDVLDLARSLSSGDAFHSRPNPVKP